MNIWLPLFSVVITCAVMFRFYGKSGLISCLLVAVLMLGLTWLEKGVLHFLGPTADTVFFCLLMGSAIVTSEVRSRKKKQEAKHHRQMSGDDHVA